jgi:hypothetical protein
MHRRALTFATVAVFLILASLGFARAQEAGDLHGCWITKPTDNVNVTLCFELNGVLQSSIVFVQEHEGFGASGLYVISDDGFLHFLGAPGDGWPSGNFHEQCKYVLRKDVDLTMSGCELAGTWTQDRVSNERRIAHHKLFGCWTTPAPDASSGKTLCFGDHREIETKQFSGFSGTIADGLFQEQLNGMVTLIGFPGEGWVSESPIETCRIVVSVQQHLEISGCGLNGEWRFDPKASTSFERRKAAK